MSCRRKMPLTTTDPNYANLYNSFGLSKTYRKKLIQFINKSSVAALSSLSLCYNKFINYPTESMSSLCPDIENERTVLQHGCNTVLNNYILVLFLEKNQSYFTSSNLTISDNQIFNIIWYKYEISLRLKYS